MKIIFLLRLWPVYGGGETVTLCLANEMVRRGWDISILYFKDHTREVIPYTNPAIHTLKIDNVDCDQTHVSAKDAFKAVETVKKYIDTHGGDIIINQWWEPAYINGLKGYHGIKIIKCSHQAFFTPRFDGKGLKATLRRCFAFLYINYRKKKEISNVQQYFSLVNKYIFLSPAFQAQYQSFSGDADSQHRLASIPNPLVFQSNITPEEIANKKNIVLVVARMEESQKMLSRIIKIWSVIEKKPELNSWQLQMVGEGADLENYKQMASRLKLQRISFEGFKDSLPYYKKAKIFCMTSALEGFGMTLIEAQQNSVVPIVMDSFLALHDIIVDGENGIITPNADLEAFATKLQILMTNRSLLNKLAVNGMKSCQKFNVENIVDKWNALLQSL